MGVGGGEGGGGAEVRGAGEGWKEKGLGSRCDVVDTE